MKIYYNFLIKENGGAFGGILKYDVNERRIVFLDGTILSSDTRPNECGVTIFGDALITWTPSLFFASTIKIRNLHDPRYKVLQVLHSTERITDVKASASGIVAYSEETKTLQLWA